MRAEAADEYQWTKFGKNHKGGSNFDITKMPESKRKKYDLLAGMEDGPGSEDES